MDNRLEEDEIVKVEMQDVYPARRAPAERPPAERLSEEHSSRHHPIEDSSRASHYDQLNNMAADQSAISVEQRAAAIMDRIKQVSFKKLLVFPKTCAQSTP